MITVKPLSASDIRAFTRRHAKLLARLLDGAPCTLELEYDDAVAATARLLVDHGQLFCELVSVGTTLSDAEINATSWPEVVKTGCQVIEATREAWRPAWPNGFMQAIIRDELRPFSSLVRKVAR